MTEKILLTGASGEIGYQTLLELLKQPERYQVRVLSLDRAYERRLFGQYSEDLEVVWGDLRNKEDVFKAVQGVSAVIHAGAVIPPLADEKPAFAREVNVGGTANILEAARSQAHPPRVIYTSSVSVYGDRIQNPEISLQDPLQPSQEDGYARTKIAAERLIQKSGLPWTIFRLSAILTDQLKIKPLMFHLPLDTSLEWCHKADVGYALVEALSCEAVYGRAFNLGGGETCRTSARAFVRRMLDLYGIAPAVLPEHAFALQNFHCGYYADGWELQSLLRFQRMSLEAYFAEMRARISRLVRFLVGLIPPWMVRSYLLRLSEPFQAIKANNQDRIAYFYGTRQRFEELLQRA